MTDSATRTALPEARPPAWNIACTGVSTAFATAVCDFCKLNADYRYAGKEDSPAPSLVARHSADPMLVLYSTRWLAAVGDQGLRAMQQFAPGSRVLLVGPVAPGVRVHDLLRLGVCGTLAEEPLSADGLARALLAATAGELWFSRGEMAAMVKHLEAARNTIATETSPDLPGLTQRENAVLRQVQLGMSNKDIARSLGIAEHTVKIHVQHIFQKLRLHRRTDLLLMRFRHDGVEPAGP